MGATERSAGGCHSCWARGCLGEATLRAPGRVARGTGLTEAGAACWGFQESLKREPGQASGSWAGGGCRTHPGCRPGRKPPASLQQPRESLPQSLGQAALRTDFPHVLARDSALQSPALLGTGQEGKRLLLDGLVLTFDPCIPRLERAPNPGPGFPRLHRRHPSPLLLLPPSHWPENFSLP